MAWPSGSRVPGADADLLDDHRGWVPSRRPASSAGRRRSACTARCRPGRRTTARRGAARPLRARGTGSRPCSESTEPPPTATGETTTREQPEVDHTGAHPDHVGDRVQSADLVEVHVLGRHAVHRPSASASRANTSWARDRTSSCSPASLRSRSTSRQVRGAGRRSTSTWQRVAARPPGGTGSLVRATSPGRHLVDGVGQHADRDADVDEGAEQHVAAGSGRRVDPARSSRSWRGVAGNPRGEDAGAVPVVDVHDASRPARRSSAWPAAPRGRRTRRRTRRWWAPPREVRRSGRRPRWAGRPPCPATTTRQSACANRSRASSTRCRPATPTSSIRSTAAPCTATVSAASAATGASEVPALIPPPSRVQWAAGPGSRRGPRRRRPPRAARTRTDSRTSAERRVASTARCGCRSCRVRRIPTTWSGDFPAP